MNMILTKAHIQTQHAQLIRRLQRDGVEVSEEQIITAVAHLTGAQADDVRRVINDKEVVA